MRIYKLEVYMTETGKEPFREWVESLRDKKTEAKIASRVTRATYGNFGDAKSIRGAKGIYEMREHYGAGYRIFYSVIENTVILLLAGSSKKDQKKAIAKAKEYLADYERKQNND